jgi:predicted Kef-type K+ transport protein
MQETTNVLKTISDSLSVIATQAEVVIKQLWLILTKQQVLLGLQRAVIGIVVASGGLWAWKLMDKTAKSHSMAKLDRRTAVVFLFFITIGLLFYGATIVVDSLPRLFNPEYYSIKEAVQMLQQVKK